MPSLRGMIPDFSGKKAGPWALGAAVFLAAAAPPRTQAETVWLETETFPDGGGWMLDTQFVDQMGSPYLLAHGLGKPVKDAQGTVRLGAAGDYRVWVRTKDWVAPWKAPGAPGRFQVMIDGKPLEATFGTVGADWHWQPGGSVKIAAAGDVKVALHDLTGFDGRCDALVFSNDPGFDPTKTARPEPPTEDGGAYDLVVCGGGYAGVASAVSAARQGLKVALIQNRPVLGGNGSSEVRVWAQGGTRRGLYPRLGEIVEEFADSAPNSPGYAEDFGDAKKEALVRSEKNIALFLEHHVMGIAMAAPPSAELKKIAAVTALDARSGVKRKFIGAFFVDCTGHGSVGALAGAKFAMLEKGHMGMSNMWYWDEGAETVGFPRTEWALPLTLDDFPAQKKSDKGTPPDKPIYKGEWFWESGFDWHPLTDLELVRDWNLRAVFGAFNALKNGPEAEKYAKARLQWVASIGGTRESRRLEGDVVLTEEDIVGKREFPDGCVPTTWDLDLHYPKQQYAKKFPEGPFISMAKFGSGVDRKQGYPVPYRCFYSKDVENLFMAGRCLSVTHEALGTVRVMRTCGMMGEVVGKAAYLCVARKTTPRGVYQSHLDDLKELFRQPGAARRESLTAPLVVPANAPKFLPVGVKYIDPAALPGIVVDDTKAELVGKWTNGENLPGYVGERYLYAPANGDAEIRYSFTVPTTGRYDVRLSHQPHENRSSKTAVTLDGQSFVVNQRIAPERPDGFHSIGVFPLEAGKPHTVTISTKGADGTVHADALWVEAVK